MPARGLTAPVDLTKYAWLSIAAAITTIAMKSGAYLLTGSVGLLSDAAESMVNLVAAVVALIALTVASAPADNGHHFGHSKAEYFSAAVEGQMIFIAAVFIVWEAWKRFLDPHPLENVGLGLGISVLASLINGAVSLILGRAGRAHRSITLIADSKHLMTDVWTSAGVVVGVLAVVLTGWLRLDPLIAMLVGVNIIWTGFRLLRASVSGLMDKSMSDERHAKINTILDKHATDVVRFHALKTRESGRSSFVTVHVLVPGDWSVDRGHDICQEVEDDVRGAFNSVSVETHLEPIEDPRAYEADGALGPRPAETSTSPPRPTARSAERLGRVSTAGVSPTSAGRGRRGVTAS